ncbi:putative mitotic spindle assembly checkpoint protein MAD1 isoform X3 [Apostichopus japonicus]|uniref:Putative mitotic spindle assembly checkpoint protein MAD1 isoform X3 n=1 Tax=Stichopus japonicus TaxID=307972 RepID=A0A2G8K8S5_STIJA|nr:putative mitotic spindle assembly checkpoint protein MAD1 isoform X3 [Apostichopus japonicus]
MSSPLQLLEEQVEDLRNKLTVLVNRDGKLSEELSNLKSSKDTLREKHDNEMKELKQKKLKLENALQDLQMSSRSHISKLKNELTQKDSMVETMETALEELKMQLKQQMRRAANAGSNRRTIEEYRVELFQLKQTNMELLQKIEDHKDSVSLAKAVGDDVKRMPILEEENKRLAKENEYLRATNENNYLLREKVIGLEAKLGRAEKKLTDISRLQVEKEDLEEKNARLEAMISKLGRGSDSEDLKEKIKQLEEENHEHKEMIKMYKDLQNMKGDFDPTRTKVLTFSSNPAAELRKKRTEDERKLIEQVEVLKERVRILEEMGHEANTQDIKLQLEKRNSKEVDELKKELEASELRGQRLKEVFKSKIHDFREACYRLTGYRISTPSDNEYNLISMYADRESDKLLFRSTSDGEMQLLENEYSGSLTDLIEAHLQQQDSIPAFLSGLTLDLFSKQTMVMQHHSLM